MHLVPLTIFIYLFPVLAGLINMKHRSSAITNAILVYCTLVTALAWQVGDDFVRYIGIINNKTSYEFTVIEPITEFLYYLTNLVDEPRLFFLFLGVINYSSLYFYIRDLKDHEKDFTIILYFLFFGIIGISLRQMSAIAINLVAIQKFYRKEYKKAGMLWILAWSIHKTSLLVLFAPLIGWILKKCNRYLLTILPVISVILIYLLQYQQD